MAQIKVNEDVSDDINLLFHHFSTQIIFLLRLNLKRLSIFIPNYLKLGLHIQIQVSIQSQLSKLSWEIKITTVL